ncbi:sulfotransferase 2A1-like [Ostrea edulis]|uniref:sulfotransferase 2A1-like n=1 Tax=Ostrea edulis TaxID=37623 RepID=UPI0024AFB79D|nr:sulfotransferase 2A1-like [Ostrea edulis]
MNKLSIELPECDGMLLPRVQPFLTDPGQRLRTIRDSTLDPTAVLLTTYPKSGTHWVWEIICMLLEGKSEYIPQSREAYYLEGLSDSDLQEVNQSKKRALSTHLPYRWLPKRHVQNGGKIVHVIRNPKDVAVSLYYHLKSGGFVKEMDIWDFVKQRFISKEPRLYGGWFEYEKEFAVRSDKVYSLHYERLNKNPTTEIRKLAEYLRVNISDDFLRDVSEKCSFQNLKEADKTIKADGMLKKMVQKAGRTGVPEIYRKGKSGTWKEHFTVAENEQLDQYIAEVMQDVHLDINFE